MVSVNLEKEVKEGGGGGARPVREGEAGRLAAAAPRRTPWPTRLTGRTGG